MRRASSGAPSSPRCEAPRRSEEHTSELQSRLHLVCRLLLEKKKKECTSVYRITIPTTDPSRLETMFVWLSTSHAFLVRSVGVHNWCSTLPVHRLDPLRLFSV